mmetsp:Transcript_4599/g.7892  ORF Transcript_4599/g.7892 Transcript_4599/m.7892 type:complete len:334 (-) Transcript_4599:1916-2917(-)
MATAKLLLQAAIRSAKAHLELTGPALSSCRKHQLLPCASWGRATASALPTLSLPAANISQQQWHLPQPNRYFSSAQDPSPKPDGTQVSTAAVDSIWTPPNMLSMARALSGPPIAWLILTDQWPAAIVATAISGATDWADGALARRLGQSSVIGSYLDPLADKVLMGFVVGALAAKGLAPTWLAVLIIGRDLGLVGGMFVHRWHMLGWRTRGLTAEDFFNTLATPKTSTSTPTSKLEGNGSPVKGEGESGLPAGGVPIMQPLFISKFNTVLQLALVGSFMTHAWAQVPDAAALNSLELLTASTTVASMAAYAWYYGRGTLFQKIAGASRSSLPK